MRNPLRFISNVTYTTPRTYLPDCPADSARVAVLIPPSRIPEAYRLAGSRFGRVVGGGRVKVRFFGETVDAEPADYSDPITETRARYIVTMPTWTPIDHEAYFDAI